MEIYKFSNENRAVLENLPQPLVVYQAVDKQIVTHIISNGFCELFGYEDRDQAYYDMNHDMFKYDHPDDVARLSNAITQFAKEEQNFDIIYRSKSRNGSEYRIIHAIGKHINTEDKTRIAYVWYTNEGNYTEGSNNQEDAFKRSVNDVLHEESILKASQYDHLTGLPGMTYFFQLAENGKKAYLAEGSDAALLYFDMNGMKYYNTKHSFTEGDKLLQAFARLLIRTFGSEQCCHIGADHFAVYTKTEGMEKTLHQLFRHCREINGGNSLPVRVGIYTTQIENSPVSVACDRAKFACDTLRNNYESGFVYFNETMQADAERRQYVLSNLDRAIRENWIQVYYQPIVRAVNGLVSDDEALARWIDPEKGFMSPADFIPYLEDAGLIYKLDLYVLEQVLRKIKNLEAAGYYVVPQSVNLSRSDFEGCDIVEEIRSRVDAAGVDRSKITIEITESTLGSNFEFMKDQLERFRQLGFPVWMDDFGSGYSSLDVLQSIKFDLIKFDMSFMQKLDEGENGKIILTELMKMANALGVDTACEGVETEEQVHFLREIGCSKLQGYYFAKPTPMEKLMQVITDKSRILYENPKESAYYETIGRVNLLDLSVMASEDENMFRNFFNTLPMCIIEISEEELQFVRSNQSYRDFIMRFYHVELTDKFTMSFNMPGFVGSSFDKLIKQSSKNSNRNFLDEQMQDGTIVHSFARRIGVNPVTGKIAIAIAVISVTEPNEGTTYANIARALAADYYNIYYVDLDTEQFIEYSSPIGGEELAVERHGENFFAAVIRDTETRIFEEDRESFLSGFSKEKILQELDKQGVFTTTYRLIDTGSPMYVNMKIMRMLPDRNHLIIGISIIDSQMKQQEEADKIQLEKTAYDRIMALTGDYLSLYTIERNSGRYIEFSTTDEYESLGLAKTGDDFFLRGRLDGMKAVYPEDLQNYLDSFSKENVLRSIKENGQFTMHYRLMLHGKPKQVSLKIVSVKERDGEKLIAGVRVWRERH